MRIEKIEKMSKEIKNYINNLGILGFYNVYTKRKKIEIQLSLKRFLKEFKNQVKNMYFECGSERNWATIKAIQYANYIEGYDIELCIKIGGIKYFCLISCKSDFVYMKDFLLFKTKLFYKKNEVILWILKKIQTYVIYYILVF